MAKLKMRKGVRVVLKKTKGADGVIVEAVAGHSWNVRWDAGPHAGQVTPRSIQ